MQPSSKELNGPDKLAEFVYWQCQIRKFSVRNLQGRPTAGMCPQISTKMKQFGSLITLIVPKHPAADIGYLKHAYLQTHDPKQRQENALKYLQSEFYQMPGRFNGEMTALTITNTEWTKQMLNQENVRLDFNQDLRHWRVDCQVEYLAQDDQCWQFTLAHNQLFNQNLTTDIQVILFKPLTVVQES